MRPAKTLRLSCSMRPSVSICSDLGSKHITKVGLLVLQRQEMPKNTFHSPAYRRFRRKLQEARAGAKLTQRQVALKLQRPHTFVAKIESGERRVDFIELQVLAKLYKKPLSYFQD